MIKGTVFHSFLRDLSASVPEAIMHRRQDQPSTRLEDPRKFAQELRAQIRSWQVRKNLAAQRDIEHAVSELTRCRNAGLRGALVWQAPHPDLPFTSDHYERLWAAAQDLDAPISMHILTGHSYHAKERKEREHYRGSVNLKLADAINAVYDFIFYGALERFPKLKIVTVENEAGWMPFIVQQWDYYYRRFREKKPVPMTKTPGEYVRGQVFSCFFNDAVCGHNLERWGQDNVMWSNDYPHWNSTWPNSLKVIRRDLGHLPAETQIKVLAGNVCKLYGLDMAALPSCVAKAAQAA